VATFIGSPSMNLLPLDGAVWKAPENGTIPSNAAIIGVRPEDITIANSTSNSPFQLAVQVAAVELVGAESYVHGEMSDGDAIVFRVPGRSAIEIGETVTITADPARFHLFDNTGKRI
jgi:sn-glycerol 3-phosphate transport system ATP-binding protein